MNRMEDNEITQIMNNDNKVSIHNVKCTLLASAFNVVRIKILFIATITATTVVLLMRNCRFTVRVTMSKSMETN